MVNKGDRPLSVLHVQPVRLVEELTKAWTVYSACNAGKCLPKKEVEYELRPMESPHPKAQKASPPRQLEAKIFIIACTWGGALGKIILVLLCMPSLERRSCITIGTQKPKFRILFCLSVPHSLASTFHFPSAQCRSERENIHVFKMIELLDV